MGCRHKCFGSRIYRGGLYRKRLWLSHARLSWFQPPGAGLSRRTASIGERGHVGVEEGHRAPPLSLCPSLCCSGKNWKGRNDIRHGKGGRKCVVLLLAFAPHYLNIYMYIYIKIIFPKLSLFCLQQ